MATKQDVEFWRNDAIMESEREAANESGKLLSCPFCGAEPGEEGPEVTGMHPGTDWVKCNGCGAHGPDQPDYDTVKGAAKRAIQVWNKRA